jgi:Fe-Mn family superoxide dismutase
MNKREFIKTSTTFTLGSMLAVKTMGAMHVSKKELYTLPTLDYSYDALEPYIDARTMEIHHSRHHAGYTNKFNAAIENENLSSKSIRDIFANVSNHSDAVRNNGGGFFNHKLYWKAMSPNGGSKPKGQLMSSIEKDFGSFDSFKEKFSTAAKTRFGSGWAWLVRTNDGLKVTSTPNQDNPLMDIAEVKGEPLLGIDVWEHAYYLKYQNKRGDYVNAFWNVINWNYVNELFEKANN